MGTRRITSRPRAKISKKFDESSSSFLYTRPHQGVFLFLTTEQMPKWLKCFLTAHQTIITQAFSEGFIIAQDRVCIPHQSPALRHGNVGDPTWIADSHPDGVLPTGLSGSSPVFCCDILQTIILEDFNIVVHA